MRLSPNWRRVALKSYSLWMNRAGFLSLLLPVLIYSIAGIDTNPVFWGWLGVILYALAEVLRYVDQGGLDSRTMRSPPWIMALAMLILAGSAAYMVSPGGVVISPPEKQALDAPAPASSPALPLKSYETEDFLSVAVPLVAKWEGMRTQAYLDTIARPPVWTICYGETRGVKQGDSYSAAECSAMLSQRILNYRDGVHQHMTKHAKIHDLTAQRDAAFASLAYNIGVGAISRSTALKRLNAGNISGACTALTWWNKAGGRVVRGLVNRRTDEFDLCMIGVVT